MLAGSDAPASRMPALALSGMEALRHNYDLEHPRHQHRDDRFAEGQLVCRSWLAGSKLGGCGLGTRGRTPHALKELAVEQRLEKERGNK